MNLSDAVSEAYRGAPKWKLAVIAVIALCAAYYLYWSFAPTRRVPANVSTPVEAAPAVTASKVAGPALKVPLQVVPRAAVRRAMPHISIPTGEEVIDTADIPRAENGVQTVTMMNLSTGTARTVYTPKPAPWFALERKNAVGATYLWTTQGEAAVAYYRRDVFRVKDLHVGGVAGVGTVGGKVGAGAGVFAEWRF